MNSCCWKTVSIPAPDKRVQRIFRGGGHRAIEPRVLAMPWPLATYTPDWDVVQDGCLTKVWQLSQGTILDLLGTNEIAPSYNTTTTIEYVQSEVWEKLSQKLHGATQEKVDTLSVGSENKLNSFGKSELTSIVECGLISSSVRMTSILNQCILLPRAILCPDH